MQKEKSDEFKRRVVSFSLEIIQLLKSLPKDYIFETLGKQLLRSATSIGANVVEAKAAPSKKDFANFFSIALKSANETRYWLYLLKQTINDSKIDALDKEVEELAKILAKSLLTIRGK